jgi:hypothetical protein
MKRTLSCVAAGVLGTLTALAPAVAAQAEYPPAPDSVVVDTGTVESGGSVTMSGTADPFSVVTITVAFSGSANAASRSRGFTAHAASSKTYTTTADAAGLWSLAVDLDQTGTAYITASGSFGVVTRTVAVAAAGSSGSSGSSGSGGLAVTGIAGGNLPMMALTGSGAVLLGGVLILGAARWRRRTRTDDAA